MWSTIKCKYVDEVINDLSSAFISQDKDEVSEIMMKVEDDTGYDFEMIYDIFVEQLEDIEDDYEDTSAAIWKAASDTIVPAYELDY